MARFKFIAFSQAVPGKEEEFERYYQEQHVRDVSRVEGVLSAERYRVYSQDGCSEQGLPQWNSLCIYEIEGDDPSAVIAAIRARAGGPEMPVSDSLFRETLLRFVVEGPTVAYN